MDRPLVVLDQNEKLIDHFNDLPCHQIGLASCVFAVEELKKLHESADLSALNKLNQFNG